MMLSRIRGRWMSGNGRGLAAGVAALAAVGVVLGGCGREPAEPDGGSAAERELRRFDFTQMHMGGQARVVVYAGDREAASAAGRAAFERIAEVDRALSDYRQDSELSRLSRAAGGEAMEVGADLLAVLELGKRIGEQTDGAFDMTAGPLTHLWREGRQAGELPERGAWERAGERVGWSHVELDRQAGRARLTRERMQLDAGGVGKGYAADAALAVLGEKGIERAMVQLSGDIAVSGPPPGADGWSIAMIEPGGERGDRVVELRDRAVSTSGHTQQFVEVDGVRYSHIIDPRRAEPMSDAYMATVMADRAAVADALATAATVLGPERAQAVVEEYYPEAEVWVRAVEPE